MNRLQTLKDSLSPWRDRLLNHQIYKELDQIESLRVFMQHHVFAVWDFMSLLKELQRRLCCTAIPWLPPNTSAHCRLINEIVLAEESDEDGRGGHASHFELYLRSMKQFGADTGAIEGFIANLRRDATIQSAVDSRAVPGPARRFVEHTFQIIDSGNLYAIAAAFTFGREDLLPDVFQRIVDKLNDQVGGQLTDFKFYLERHIGLDGDEHGPLAQQLVESLCDTDERRWIVAKETAVACLTARYELWNGIYESVCINRDNVGRSRDRQCDQL